MQEKAPYNKEAASRKATYETAKKKYDSKDSKVKFRANCRISIRLDSTVEMVLFSFVCHLSPHNWLALLWMNQDDDDEPEVSEEASKSEVQDEAEDDEVMRLLY